MKAKKQINMTDMILSGIVVDTSNFYQDDTHIQTISRLVNGSALSHQALADKAGLHVDTIKRLSTLKECESGEAYNPMLSTFTKTLDALGLYSVYMEPEKTQRKTKLKSIKGGKVKK